MKFLHTSDWHLGKIFFEHSLIEDQKHILNQIIEELRKAESDKAPYDALIVAGDVYDRPVPPPEAVSFFDNFLNSIHSEFPELHLFFSSGNHDSATRISFGAGLFHSQNIHIATRADECDRGIVVGSGDKAAIVYQIPFLTMGSLSLEDGTVLRHQDELVGEACARIKKAHGKNELPAVVTAHVFAGSSSLDGSEKNFVGTAEQIDANHFKSFNYTALGHIHKPQQAGSENVRYCGSPLAYTFGENNRKIMLRVEVTKDRTEFTEIEFNPLHKVTRLEGTYEDFMSGPFSENRDDYLELLCTDSFCHDNPMEALRGKFPNLLSFRMQRSEAGGQNMAIQERKKALENIASGDYGKLFSLFMNDIYKNNREELESDLFRKEQKLFIKTAEEVGAGEE